MQYTLHITADRARLIKACWDIAAAERALKVPVFEGQAAANESVTAFKSRRAALRFCAERRIKTLEEIHFKTIVVA